MTLTCQRQVVTLTDNDNKKSVVMPTPELESQRLSTNHLTGRSKKRRNIIPRRIGSYIESVQAVMKKFPDYELPLTVQTGVHYNDPQRLFHLRLSSTLRRKFRTGSIYKNPNWKVKNPITAEEKKREFEETIQRLIARDRVFGASCQTYNNFAL